MLPKLIQKYVVMLVRYTLNIIASKVTYKERLIIVIILKLFVYSYCDKYLCTNN